jgi:uncharacterized protein YchJ
MKPIDILEACESANKDRATECPRNFVSDNAKMMEPRRGMRSRKSNTMLKDFVKK